MFFYGINIRMTNTQLQIPALHMPLLLKINLLHTNKQAHLSWHLQCNPLLLLSLLCFHLSVCEKRDKKTCECEKYKK